MSKKEELVKQVKEMDQMYNLGIEEQLDVRDFSDIVDIIASTRSMQRRGEKEYGIEDIAWSVSIFCFPFPPWGKSYAGIEDEEDSPSDNEKPKLMLRNALVEQVRQTGDLQVFIPYRLIEREPGTIFGFMIPHPENENAVVTLRTLFEQSSDLNDAVEYVTEYRR